jgi:predicted nuclease of predicted toxin-antitoxin system
LKFLANENIPSASVAVLEAAGHDILHVAEACPGEADVGVLELAQRQARIVVTFDRDYGELVFRLRKPRPAGVVYLRFDTLWPTEPGEILASIVGSVSLEGCFTVVERNRLRQRPLPAV